MNKRGFVSSILQNFRKPEGFFGRMILWGMNTGHASLAQWGMSCLQWQPEWSVLDIGCGGGATTDFPILIMRSMRSLLSRLSTSGVTCSMLLRKWRVC